MSTAAGQDQSQSLHALLTLVQLEKRLRWAAVEEARFITVNETHRLLPYRQAILLEWDKASPLPPRATAASGILQVDQDSALARGLVAIATAWKAELPEGPIEVATAAAGGVDGQSFREALDGDRLFALPVQGGGSGHVATLFLVRHQPLSSGEAAVIEKLADAVAHALTREKTGIVHAVSGFAAQKKKRRLALAALVFALLFPVRASVIAPAEVVAENPIIIRSPLQGIIAALGVEPNQAVETGAPLVTFDQDQLRAKAEAARQSLAASAAELRQASVMAVSDSEARTNLATLQGRVEQQRINLAYAESQAERAVIAAPASGVAVFDNVYDWIGRNVSVGERIMLLADPAHTRLEIRLPVQDAMALPEDARILFFSAAVPHRPFEARLAFSSYRASMDERSALSYRLEGVWKEAADAENMPRLGSVGNAKIYGPWRPLIWQLLRRPLTAARGYIGF